MKTVFYRFAMSLWGIILLIGLSVIYIFIWYENPPAIIEGPQDTSIPEYHTGDQIFIWFERDVRASRPSRTVFRLVPESLPTSDVTTSTYDGRVYIHGPIRELVPGPLIPIAVSPGKYHVEAVTTYEITNWAKRSVSWQTVPFMIATRAAQSVEPQIIRVVGEARVEVSYVEVPVQVLVPGGKETVTIETVITIVAFVPADSAPLRQPSDSASGGADGSSAPADGSSPPATPTPTGTAVPSAPKVVPPSIPDPSGLLPEPSPEQGPPEGRDPPEGRGPPFEVPPENPPPIDPPGLNR